MYDVRFTFSSFFRSLLYHHCNYLSNNWDREKSSADQQSVLMAFFFSFANPKEVWVGRVFGSYTQSHNYKWYKPVNFGWKVRVVFCGFWLLHLANGHPHSIPHPMRWKTSIFISRIACSQLEKIHAKTGREKEQTRQINHWFSHWSIIIMKNAMNDYAMLCDIHQTMFVSCIK